MLSASVGFGVHPRRGDPRPVQPHPHHHPRIPRPPRAWCRPQPTTHAKCSPCASSRRQLPLRPCLCLGCATHATRSSTGHGDDWASDDRQRPTHQHRNPGNQPNSPNKSAQPNPRVGCGCRAVPDAAPPSITSSRSRPHPTCASCEAIAAERACTAIAHAAPPLSASSPNYAPACWKPTNHSPAPEHSNTSPPHASQPKHSTSSTQQRDNHSCH